MKIEWNVRYVDQVVFSLDHHVIHVEIRMDVLNVTLLI